MTLHLRARARRMLHLWRYQLHLKAPHMGLTCYDQHGDVSVLACTCGASFWEKKV